MNYPLDVNNLYHIHLNTFVYIYYYSNFSHIILSSTLRWPIVFVQSSHFTQIIARCFTTLHPPQKGSLVCTTPGERTLPTLERKTETTRVQLRWFFYPLEVTGEPNVSPNFHPSFFNFHPIFALFSTNLLPKFYLPNLNWLHGSNVSISQELVNFRGVFECHQRGAAGITPQNDLKMTFRVGKW